MTIPKTIPEIDQEIAKQERIIRNLNYELLKDVTANHLDLLKVDEFERQIDDAREVIIDLNKVKQQLNHNTQSNGKD